MHDVLANHFTTKACIHRAQTYAKADQKSFAKVSAHP